MWEANTESWLREEAGEEAAMRFARDSETLKTREFFGMHGPHEHAWSWREEHEKLRVKALGNLLMRLAEERREAATVRSEEIYDY